MVGKKIRGDLVILNTDVIKVRDMRPSMHPRTTLRRGTVWRVLNRRGRLIDVESVDDLSMAVINLPSLCTHPWSSRLEFKMNRETA